MKKKRNLTLIIGAVLTAFMLLFLLIGFFYTPYDPDAMNGAAKFAAPLCRTRSAAITLDAIFSAAS